MKALTWKKAQSLTPSEFGARIIKLLGDSAGENVTHRHIAEMTYRSYSRVMTWLAPSSKEPLPLNERHHMWLAVNEEIRNPSITNEVRKKGKRWTRCDSVVTWTQEDDDYIRENYRKIKAEKIAKHLGRSAAAIYQRAGNLKISANSSQKRRGYSSSDLKILSDVNYSDAEVAKRIGRPKTSVNTKRQRMGIYTGKRKGKKK